MATIDPAILLQLLTGMAGDQNTGTLRNPVMKAGNPQFSPQDIANITRPGGTVMNPNTPTLPVNPDAMMSMLPQVSEMNQSVQPPDTSEGADKVRTTAGGAPAAAPAPKPVQPKTAAGGQKDVARVLQKLGLEDVPDAVDAEQDPRLQALRGKKGGLEQSRADLLKRADEPTSTGDLIGQALVGLLPGLLGLGIGGAVAGTHGAAAGAAGGFSGAAEGLGKLQQTKREDKAKLVQRAEQEGDRAEKIEGMEGQRTDTLEGRSLAAQEAARVRNQHAGQFNAAQENDDIAGEKNRAFTAKQNAIAGNRSDRHLAATLAQRDREAYREYLAKVNGQKAVTNTDAQKAFYSNVDSALKSIQQMRDIVQGVPGKSKAYGNFESEMFGDSKAAAGLESLPYMIAVNTAKILDPATAAREGEVEAGRKYLVKAGLLTPSGVTLESLNLLEASIKNKAKEMNTAFNDPIPENATGGQRTEGAPADNDYSQYRIKR